MPESAPRLDERKHNKTDSSKDDMMRAFETMKHGLAQPEGSIVQEVALDICHVIVVKDLSCGQTIFKEMDRLFLETGE
eukprot:3486638-Amphidinium_carterae.3